MFKDFIQRPAIKQSFDANASKLKVPGLADAAAATGPADSNAAALSAAFDYLMRFEIARWTMTSGRDLTLWETGWIAERSVEAMESSPDYAAHFKKWSGFVTRARQVFGEYAKGGESVDTVAACVQYLGCADLLTRIGKFNPTFRHTPEMQRELITLHSKLQAHRAELTPKSTVILNPHFVHGYALDGVDASLAVDQTLVAIRTTKNAAMGSPECLKMVSLCALHALGGIDLLLNEGGEREVYTKPFTHIAVYFSRQGLFARWPLSEVMPDGGFSRFQASFHAELHGFISQRAEA